jgi:hypothetical protein
MDAEKEFSNRLNPRILSLLYQTDCGMTICRPNDPTIVCREIQRTIARMRDAGEMPVSCNMEFKAVYS